MDSSLTTLKSVTIELPLDFVKKILERGPNQSPHHDLFRCPFNGEEVNVTAQISNAHLSLFIDSFFLHHNGDGMEFIIHGCNRTTADLPEAKSEIFTAHERKAIEKPGEEISSFSKVQQKQSISGELSKIEDKPVKKKRGRPRKTEKNIHKERIKAVRLPCKTGRLEEDCDLPNNTETLFESNKIDIEEKRYNLRGKKLNASIMESEKREAGLLDQETESEKLTKDGIQNAVESMKNDNDPDYSVMKKVDDVLYAGNEKLGKEEKQLTCKLCLGAFSGLKAIKDHLLEIHSSYEEIDNYISSEDKNQIYSCLKCEYKTNVLGSLKIHIRNKHMEPGIKRAFCHLCSASFRSYGSLKQHIDLNHHGNKHVTCNICKKQFYNKSQLRRHQRIHGSDPDKKVFCPMCKKGFLFEFNLKRHIQTIHKPQSECFHCSYCGRGYSQKTAMISHVQLVHFNLFPYSCKECKENFQRANLLKDHMAAVHLQPDFQVPLLLKHSIYDRTDEDKFFCSFCSKSFLHKIRLIEHMHTDHASAFPYRCDQCIQGFLEKSFLQIHALKAHGTLLNEDELASSHVSRGEILKIITTKTDIQDGVAQNLVSEETADEKDIGQPYEEDSLYTAERMDFSSEEHAEVSAAEVVTGIQASDQSSVLIEVANGDGTMQYVIDTSDLIGQHDSTILVQDIANFLVAAERSNAEQQNETGQEISFILSNPDRSDSTDPIEMDIQNQGVETSLGQTGKNIFAQINNQTILCEREVNQKQQNITSENQVQLQLEPGDSIELTGSDTAVAKIDY